MSLTNSIIVYIDPGMEALIPRYLENQHKALAAMQQAWAAHDYDTLRSLSHKMKGSAGGYGFDALSDLGSALEQAAQARDALHIQECIKAISSYLDCVEVVYA